MTSGDYELLFHFIAITDQQQERTKSNWKTIQLIVKI